MFVKKEEKTIFKKLRLIFVIVLLGCIFLLSFGVYRILIVKNPTIYGYEELEKLPRKKEVHLRVESNFPVKSIHIEITQGVKHIVLLKDNPDQSHKEYDIKINPRKLGLKDGLATVIMRSKAGIFSKTRNSFTTTIDTIPPVISVTTSSYLARQGRAGAALIKAEGADRVYIKIHNHEYTANNIVTEKENLYFALFPVHMDVPIDSIIYAISEDTVGNKAISTVQTRIKTTDFRKAIVKIDDNFIKKKIYPLLGEESEKGLSIHDFILVNEEMRKENENKIIEITKNSAPKMLWQGKFLQMRNSKVFSNFGEMRNYEYKGEIVSHSRHLGYDLASTKNVQIEASNSGIVAFAGGLGIYGNTVIIDHGLGLMSMYAHLSSISVKEGESVEKEYTIGRSGMTGLAGGDHLHFAILIHGVYVSPLPWWDKNWIEKRILNILHNR